MEEGDVLRVSCGLMEDPPQSHFYRCVITAVAFFFSSSENNVWALPGNIYKQYDGNVLQEFVVTGRRICQFVCNLLFLHHKSLRTERERERE